jgi:hypothetical protein
VLTRDDVFGLEWRPEEPLGHVTAFAGFGRATPDERPNVVSHGR